MNFLVRLAKDEPSPRSSLATCSPASYVPQFWNEAFKNCFARIAHQPRAVRVRIRGDSARDRVSASLTRTIYERRFAVNCGFVKTSKVTEVRALTMQYATIINCTRLGSYDAAGRYDCVVRK